MLLEVLEYVYCIDGGGADHKLAVDKPTQPKNMIALRVDIRNLSLLVGRVRLDAAGFYHLCY